MMFTLNSGIDVLFLVCKISVHPCEHGNVLKISCLQTSENVHCDEGWVCGCSKTSLSLSLSLYIYIYIYCMVGLKKINVAMVKGPL